MNIIISFISVRCILGRRIKIKWWCFWCLAGLHLCVSCILIKQMDEVLAFSLKLSLSYPIFTFTCTWVSIAESELWMGNIFRRLLVAWLGFELDRLCQWDAEMDGLWSDDYRSASSGICSPCALLKIQLISLQAQWFWMSWSLEFLFHHQPIRTWAQSKPKPQSEIGALY